MTECKHAASGCNYPEGECLGVCVDHQGTKRPSMSAQRFEKTFCSQCGAEFGPGGSGYSHCDRHSGKKNLSEQYFAHEITWAEFYERSGMAQHDEERMRYAMDTSQKGAQ